MSDISRTADLRAAVVDILERSATFEERIAAGRMIAKPVKEDEVLAICRAANVQPKDVRVRGPLVEMFSRVYLQEHTDLPAWASALELLLEDPTPDGDLPDLGPESTEGAREIAVAFTGMLRSARAWLDGEIAASAVSVEPAARRGIVSWLARMLMSHAHLVVTSERRASTNETTSGFVQKLASRSGWLSLLSTYPVLGRLFGIETNAWQRDCTLLLRRLATDWTALGQPGQPTLADVSVLTLKHSQGANPPLLVTLPSGKRVVYHGKDLRIEAWFVDVVAALAGGLTPSLEPRAILARDRYAWADYVESAPVSSRTQVESYFTRAGMYLRLFQALRTIDMHGRNVIAAGEHPAFIDLETVLQPPRGLPGGSAVALATRERFDDSVLAVSLLPVWLAGEPGLPAINVGGLNRGGNVVFPGDPPDKRTRIDPTVPAIDAVPASLGDHLPHLLAGYRSMSAALAKSEVLPSLLARAEKLRVAVLWRSGIMHKRIADQSVVPLLLTDGRFRETFLTRLVLGLPDDISRRLGLHELWAIRDGAAPSFEAQPGSDAMYLPDGTNIPGMFSSTALARVQLVRSAIDTDRDIDAIQSAIGIEAESRNEAPPAFEVGPTASADATTPLDHAIAIADFIAAESVTVGDEAMWLGSVWLPTAGARRVDILPIDLLSGSAGLAVLFAYLHRRTAAGRFRDAALHALGPVVREVRGATSRGQFRVGAFAGLGGQLYALAKCDELLGDSTHAELVKRCFSSISPAVAAKDSPRDVITGAAGIVLVAANMLEPFSRPPNLGHIASQLREPVTQHRERFVGGPRWLAGLPGEHEGIAWALARWFGLPKGATVEDASVLTRIACSPSPALDKYIVAKPPRATIADLVTALAARDAIHDAAFGDRARVIADAIVARRRESGRWLDDPYVADRYHLSAISGLGALALALARIDAPELPCCVRLLY